MQFGNVLSAYFQLQKKALTAQINCKRSLDCTNELQKSLDWRNLFAVRGVRERERGALTCI